MALTVWLLDSVCQMYDWCEWVGVVRWWVFGANVRCDKVGGSGMWSGA